MNNLFDYGEFLLCFGPVFLIILMVFLALIWNNLPSRTVVKESKVESKDAVVEDDIRSN